MRAIAISGFSATPELTDLPTPAPGPDEILVRLTAACLNPIDTDIAAGHLSLAATFPLTLGTDGAGHVVEVGESVTGFAPGDAVHGQFLPAPLAHGTFADHAVVTAAPAYGALVHTPEGLAADLAAALPTAGMTAIGVVESLDLGPGRSILIVGATGGVGVFAVQLAAATGAEVIATARADADAWIRALGATQTIDYTAPSSRAGTSTEDFPDPDPDPDPVAVAVAERVRKTHPDGVDALLDLTRDPARFAAYSELVRDGGTAISTTFTASPELLASERVTVANFMMRDKPGLLARITEQVASGRVTVPIDRTIALEEVPEALNRTASGGARGKTVVRI